MLDSFLTLLRVLFYLLAFLFFLMALPFIICHVAEHWDAPEYPHTGYTPDCPTWEAPAAAPAELWRGEPADEVENTLPPTYSLAGDSDL